MTSSPLDRETRYTLRSKAARLKDLLAPHGVDQRPTVAEKLEVRVARRWEWYQRVEDAVLDLVNALPVDVEDYEARQLLVFLTALRRALDTDNDGTDKADAVELAAMQMTDVVARMDRRLERSAFDDTSEAARYVIEQLNSVGITELARVLGVSTKTVRAWRLGRHVEQNAERVKLTAHLVSYLRYSMTQTGLIMWFDHEAYLLGGRSPLQLIDESVSTAWEPLISYARGGRGQLAG